MDRGLQERLVGAAVLVALGVWLIPWVLDGSAEPERAADAPAVVKLPVPETQGARVLRRETIELSAQRGSGLKSGEEDAESDATGTRAGVVASPPEEQGAQREATSVAENSAQAASASAGQTDRQPIDPEPTNPASQSPAEPATRTAATEVPAARPAVITAAPIAGWMVQLGSFSDAANARRQAQRVETYGHDAGIYEFAAAGGRTMFRVRLGPLETRERAEAAASSLTAHGFVAQLVAPE